MSIISPHPLPKEKARQRAYRAIHAENAARFPFPIEGRIPNFVGAEKAAKRLGQLAVYRQAQAVKVNPDAPQLPVRAMVLADGKTLYMPSPRLRGGFIRIDPTRVPPGEERRAASLSHCQKYGEPLDLEKDSISIDLIVTGSVAVARDGGRAGKGAGYADLEYAIFRELGLPPMPVVTTVHRGQIVESLQIDEHDMTVDWIITPEETIETDTPYPKPERIQWHRLSADDLDAMPVLAQLRQSRWQSFTTPEIIAEGLNILFVGINPGRKSAAIGHNFAGPGNHFWRLLHDANLTPVLYEPHEEKQLLRHGLGITNIISRSSRGESDLSWDEFVAGGRQLWQKIQRWRPIIVAFLGKNVYRAYAGMRPSSRIDWGLQSPSVVEGVHEFVAPNPSARSTIRYNDRLDLFRQLKQLAAEKDRTGSH